jgi:hypothetical protein
VRVNAALGEMNGSGWVAKTGLAELQEGESREELVARAAVVMHGE